MRHEAYMREVEEVAQAGVDLFGFVPVVTQCGNCDQIVPLQSVVVSVFHITPYITDQEHFCGPTCAKEWWETFRAKDD